MGESKVRETKRGEVNIREIKREIPGYEFTCPRCGAHSFAMAAVSQDKRGGYGLKPETIRVCRNCHYADGARG